MHSLSIGEELAEVVYERFEANELEDLTLSRDRLSVGVSKFESTVWQGYCWHLILLFRIHETNWALLSTMA